MTITSDQIVLFRIVERLTLTVIVLLVAAVVMIGFWRSVQKLDITQGGKIGVAGSFAFSTPVFVLLAIIGYAYVSLSFPIEVSAPAAQPDTVTAEAGARRFLGVGGDAAPPATSAASLARLPAALPDPDYELGQAQRLVRAINCVASRAAPDERLETDLIRAKLAVLAPVWPATWGDRSAFGDAVLGISGEPPHPLALEVFDRVDSTC
ncbi:MAG: hypothetical protein KDA73_16950 [Rhodobacteraceae bacterium]|nr:hypothetical protein [Paracoccaceae bacterium]